MLQLITPNPDIPCTPGWCLQYVRQAFGLPARYPTATAAWEASTSQHTGRDVPAGVWTPVWYGLDREPAGHVVLHAPDGSVYSTSDNSTTPHHHPNLDDLEAFYAGWGWPLTWRGWTEDVAGTPVIAPGADITTQGTTTTETDEDMALSPETQNVLNETWDASHRASSEATNAKTAARECLVAIQALEQRLASPGAAIDYAAIAKAVADEEAKRMAG